MSNSCAPIRVRTTVGWGYRRSRSNRTTCVGGLPGRKRARRITSTTPREPSEGPVKTNRRIEKSSRQLGPAMEGPEKNSRQPSSERGAGRTTHREEEAGGQATHAEVESAGLQDAPQGVGSLVVAGVGMAFDGDVVPGFHATPRP